MSFDAFISYSSKDNTTANAACAALETSGVRCWIAPRDIRAGAEYGAGIIEGIDACRIMVLIFSSNANASPQIHREIERAVSKGLTIIPLRIENIVPTEAMEYYLGSIHWLDALTPPLAEHLGQLVEQVRANLKVEGGVPPRQVPGDVFGGTSSRQRAPSITPSPTARSDSWPGANAMQLVLVVMVLALTAVVFLIWRLMPSPPQSPLLSITRSAGFGGSGGAPFDEMDNNVNNLPVSAVTVGLNVNPQDSSQGVIGSLQVHWGATAGPAHGTNVAQPPKTVTFAPGEKIGRVDIAWGSYTYATSDNVAPQWVAGLQIWTNVQVYPFGDLTFGQIGQCILADKQILLGFFGRSGAYVDQLGCIVGQSN